MASDEIGPGSPLWRLDDDSNRTGFTGMPAEPREALDWLHRVYRRLLAAMIFKSSGRILTRAETVDAYQDMMCDMVRRVHRGGSLPGNLVAYAFGAARKKGLDALRKRSRRREQQADDDVWNNKEGLGEDDTEEFEPQPSCVSVERIHKIIEGFLSPNKEIAMIWLDPIFGGKSRPTSLRQISISTGLSIKQVRTRLTQIKNMLRGDLGDVA